MPRAAVAAGSARASRKLRGTGLSLCPIFGVLTPRTAADTRTVRVRYAIGGMIVTALLALPAGAGAKQGGAVNSLTTQQCAEDYVDDDGSDDSD